MTKIEARFRNYVSTHKKAIAATVVASAIISLQNRHIKGLNGFLDEKDLTEEYYGQFMAPEDVE